MAYTTLNSAARSLAGPDAAAELIERWMDFLEERCADLPAVRAWRSEGDGEPEDQFLRAREGHRIHLGLLQTWAAKMGFVLDAPSTAGKNIGGATREPRPCLYIDSGRDHWTVAEAIELTSHAAFPSLPSDTAPLVYRLLRCGPRPSEGILEIGRLMPPDKNEWLLLDQIWAGLPRLELPLTVDEWASYQSAFDNSPLRPQWWTLQPEVAHPGTDTHWLQKKAAREHAQVLTSAVNTGAIAIFHPTRQRRIRPGASRVDDTHLLRLEGLWALSERLGLHAHAQVPAGDPMAFVDKALAHIAPDQIEPPHATQLVQRLVQFGHAGRTEVWRSCDLRKTVEARVARQCAGYFTLEEAASMLAVVHTELDASEFAAQMRRAAAAGELPLYDGTNRFKLDAGAPVFEFLDLVRAGELDTWLKEAAGHRFPPDAIETPGANGRTANVRNQPLARFEAQELAVLDTLRRLGHHPLALPRNQVGIPGVKAAAWKALAGNQLFVGDKVFAKAWERLRASQRIKDAR